MTAVVYAHELVLHQNHDLKHVVKGTAKLYASLQRRNNCGINAHFTLSTLNMERTKHTVRFKVLFSIRDVVVASRKIHRLSQLITFCDKTIIQI